MAASVQNTVEDALRALVTDGMRPGEKLPPERELAERLSVSRMTLRAAVERLQFEGVLLRRPGRGGGTFVAQESPVVELASVRGILAQLSAETVTSRVLAAEVVDGECAPQEVTAALGVRAGGVVRLNRVRNVAGEPAMLEDSWFPADLVPGLLEEDLTGSMYRLLRDRYGSEPVGKREVLQPGSAGAEEAAHLGIGARHPVLRIERTAYRADGRAVEYSLDTYRSDRLRIQVTTGTVNSGE